MDTLLLKTIDKLNDINGSPTISASFFDSLFARYDKAHIVDAAIWLDKSLEEKNVEMLIGGLSDPPRGREILDRKYFDGYEVIHILAEASDSSPQEGIKIGFERQDKDPSGDFLEAELAELSFSFGLKNTIKPVASIFADLFTDQINTDNTDSENDSDELGSCNRGLPTWSMSCLVSWLKELPTFFSEFITIIPTFNKDGKITPEIVSKQSDNVSVNQIKISPERISFSAGETLPQKIEVSLLDENNEIIKNDFSTQVQLKYTGSDFNKFFELLSEKTQTVQGGKISFFLSPKETTFGGNFSFDVIIPRSTKKGTVPVQVSLQKMNVFSEKSILTAGDSVGAEIEVKVLNLAGTIAQEYDGKEIKLTSNEGRFMPSEKVVIRDGVAFATFLPHTKAGEATVKIIDTDQQLPMQTINFLIETGTADQIIWQEEPLALVKNALPVEISVAIADRFQNVIPEMSSDIVFSAENATVIADADSGSVKIQATATTESFANILVDSPRLEKKGWKKVCQ